MDEPIVPPDQTVRELLKGAVSPEQRKRALLVVMRFDVRHANAGQMLMTSETVHDDNIYRVSVLADGVDVIGFGLSSIDSGISGHYDCVDDLPEWVKERLAVLMITSGTPPTQEVAGVGRRISSHVYWVYAPART
jgi:hypothetical protein